MGCKRKRVEDVRFVQGKGNYVDDLKLPGMLYGDFMRSPHAHALRQWPKNNNLHIK
jgi:aerobic carbon-monoxide dehydrogenase large subunit